MTRAKCKGFASRFILGAFVLPAFLGLGAGSSNAQQIAARADQLESGSVKPQKKAGAAVALATPGTVSPARQAKPVRRAQSLSSGKGPYYVDFRARTAATYGHAFMWFGKTNEKQVEVAGLHPAGDEVPYMLGHLTFVPAETGASYGDLDVQYLTASYRVYLNEDDAKKVFAYIKHLQATSPVWNAETMNCTMFMGRVAGFMGLKVPFHLQKPEAYVNELRDINGGRQTAQLSADR